MNVGDAITGALRSQRRRDLLRIYRRLQSPQDRHRFQAWLWWGWHINRPGGTGVPGWSWPYWSEPRRWKP